MAADHSEGLIFNCHRISAVAVDRLHSGRPSSPSPCAPEDEEPDVGAALIYKGPMVAATYSTML